MTPVSQSQQQPISSRMQLNDFVRFCPFNKLFLHAVGVP